ncbi:MAG: glycosyltransferase family 4 protein [Candidatus Fermentibacteraceae bacterium]|nr:glycosyltransferase family 4 protein [Candidatus Fermentibacteraceae bacterium]
MRILVTINCSGVDASADGGLALARMMGEGGHQVLVQAPPGGPVSACAGEMGLDTSGPDLRKASLVTGLFPFRRLVRRFAPDVICATRADGQTASALAAAGFPLVRIRCDIRKPGSGRAWSIVDRRTDLVVFPSPFMADRGYHGERQGPVAVVPHPVDTERFCCSPPPSTGEQVLVSLGRLSPMKGHRTLIKALGLLPGNVTAIIAGPPSQQSKEELMAFADELGVADRLTVTGRLEDPVEIISRGSIGVVTSLGSEVVSRAGMEMMSSGLPLLAAATNGLLDLVKDGETGLLHSPGNYRQLASQAGLLFDSPSLADRMGRKSRKVCVDEYSFAAVRRKWEDLLAFIVPGEQNPVSQVSSVKKESR